MHYCTDILLVVITLAWFSRSSQFGLGSPKISKESFIDSWSVVFGSVHLYARVSTQ